jgi:hypothetical protein
MAYHYRMISHMPLKESEVLAVPENNIQYRWISLQEVCDYLGVKRHTGDYRVCRTRRKTL